MVVKMFDFLGYFAETVDSLTVFWGSIPELWDKFLDTMQTFALIVGAIAVVVVYTKLSGDGGGTRTVNQYINRDGE